MQLISTCFQTRVLRNHIYVINSKTKQTAINFKMKRKKESENDFLPFDDHSIAKRSKLFSGMKFRQKLTGEDPLPVLQTFLQVFRENAAGQDIVLEYFEAGGTGEEILLLLGNENRSIEEISVIFKVLQCIFIRIVTDLSSYLPDAEETSKCLLQSHTAIFHRMFGGSSNFAAKKAALKLLTVMSTLSARVAKYILTYLKLNFAMLYKLAKEEKQYSTRTHFIHFVLSFMVEGNPAVIKLMLDKTGLLKSIFPGLMYDSPDTIELILMTIKKYVLENPAVTKTTKLHLFNSTTLRIFFELFNWKGMQKPIKKKFAKDASESIVNKVDPVSKSRVEEATYQILTVVCASRKFGVIFFDPSFGSSGKNYNQLVQKVLEILEKPWEKDVVAKLLLDIFSACPDLIHLTISRMGPFVEPRLSPNWFKAVDFIIKIIDGVYPKKYLSKAGSLSVAQLITIFEQIVTPKSILRVIFGSSMKETTNEGIGIALKSSHLLVRHSAICLLNSISNAALRFVDFNGLEDYFGSPGAASQFCQDLLDHLFTALPNVTCILQAWEQSVEDIENKKISEDFDSMEPSCNIPCPTAIEHLKEILKLLLAYVRWSPPLEVTAEGDSVGDGWSLLNNPKFLTVAQHFNELEPMALELLSATGSFTLSASQGTINREIFKRLLFLLGKEDEKSCRRTWRRLLLSILLKTGFFDGNEMEACLWIHSFWHCCYKEYSLEDEKINTLAEFIVSSLCNAINSSENYLCLISNAFEAANDSEKSQEKDSAKSLLIDLMEEDIGFEDEASLVNEKVISLQKCVPTISPLLPAALFEMKNYKKGTPNHDTISYYLLYVAVNIFHGQDSSEPLLYLLESDLSSYAPPKSLKKYLKSWSSVKLHCVDEIISGDIPLSHCSRKLLAKTKSSNASCDDILTTFNSIEDGLHVLFLFRLIIFHLAYLAQQNNLNEAKLAIGKDMLLSLFKDSCLSEKEENIICQKANGKDMEIYGLCLQSAFNNSILLKFFNPLGGKDESQKSVTHLVDHILNLANLVLDDRHFINNLTLSFEKKLIQTICESLDEISQHKDLLVNWDEGSMQLFLSHFSLSSENILLLLDKYAKIPPGSLIQQSNFKLSGPGLLLIQLLDELCKRRKFGCQAVVKSSSFKPVADILYTLEELSENWSTNSSENGLSVLEDCILQVLQIFPHLIEVINPRLSKLLISSSNGKSADTLGQFLICESEKFRAFFIELCSAHKNKFSANSGRLLMYLENMIRKGKSMIPDDILVKIYEEYKGEFKDIFNKSLKVPLWLKNNMELFKVIVQKAIDEERCFKLWSLIRRKANDFIDSEHCLLEMIYSLLKKAEKSPSLCSEESPHVSFLKLILNGFIKVLNAVSNDSSSEKLMADLIFYTELIGAILDGTDKKDEKLTEKRQRIYNNWNMVQKEKIWREFTQLSLKISIGQSNAPLLKCFRKICSKVLIKSDSEAVLLYKMCIMHSKFLDVMLEGQSAKGEILEFLMMLIEKNSTNSSTSLVPVLFSSYGASLEKSDLVILKLLKLLDRDELNFHQFSPYLWGEMAASFYSLRNQVGSAAFSAFSVLRQPKADQVLDLLDLNHAERTLSNFPIHRSFHAEESFDVGSGDLSVYDPCFYLPLFSHILAPENPVKFFKFTQTGAFALTVVALGSRSNQVRATAMHVLARFYSHLETGKINKEKKLWMNFIDVVRNGFGLLSKSKNADVSCLQLPPVVAVFLAKASVVMAEPQHVMFFPLHNFFLAKPALDLEVVPEFFRLYNSTEENARLYRHWILEVLRDGVKDPLDFNACLNSGIFKLLMSSFCSEFCDDRSKVLILEILVSAVKIPSTAYYLVRGHGLLSWLTEVVRQSAVYSNKEETNFVKVLIHLLLSLWKAFSEEELFHFSSGKDRQNSLFNFLYNNVISLHLHLLPKMLHIDLNLKDFLEYIKSLRSVTQLFNKSQQRTDKLIKRKDIDNVIQLGKKVLKNVDICQDAFQHECYIFPPSEELFSGWDATEREALQYLFMFVVDWCQTDVQ